MKKAAVLRQSKALTLSLLLATLIFAYQNCGNQMNGKKGAAKLFERPSDLSCEQMKYVPVELQMPSNPRAGSEVQFVVPNGNMYFAETMLLQLGSRYCDIINPDPSICRVEIKGNSVVIRTVFNQPGTESIVFSAFDTCRYGRAKVESLCIGGPGNECPVPSPAAASSLVGMCSGKKPSFNSCQRSDECCSNNCVEGSCMPSSTTVVQ